MWINLRWKESEGRGSGTDRVQCKYIELVEEAYLNQNKMTDMQRGWYQVDFSKNKWHGAYLLPQKPNTPLPSLPVYSTFCSKQQIIYRKRFSLCCNLTTPPPPIIQDVLLLHIFAFCSQESGDGVCRAETQGSTTSLPVCQSVCLSLEWISVSGEPFSLFFCDTR